MHLSIIALASTEWGVSRFTTDSFSIIALGILVAIPILLIKDKIEVKNVWSSGNALTNR